MISARAGSPADDPPANIIEHFKWCASGRDTSEKILRYDGFWRRYHPQSEEYEDAIHVRFVRLCAYRLAILYAETHKLDESRAMLQWLEKHDQAVQ